MQNRQNQLGVALISALLVVAIATTAAVTLSSSMQLNLRRSANLYTRDQAWQYLLGVEEFGKVLLKQALEHDKLDLLLGEERTLPVEGGAVTGRVIDLQAGINLNDLIDAGNDNENPVAKDRIEKIFSAQGVDAKRIAALIDWVDKNDDVKGADGAEDNYYFGLQPPYRAANGLMESVSELYLLREMTAEEVDLLLDVKVDGKPVRLLSTLPPEAQKSGLTPVNINTAPEVVLSAIGIVNTEDVLKNRPYEKKPTYTELGIAEKDKQKVESMDITSHYFQLEASAQIGQARLRSFSIIQRGKDNAMKVISRSFGTE